MLEDAQAPLKIFFAYAREDEALREKMEVHLSSLRRDGLISPWSDRLITAGMDWEYEIDKSLNAASIILLLISPDFIASDYCYSIEMTRALERHRRNEARVIPVLLRPCHWHEAPFARLAVLPTNAQPVTLWPDRDEAFHNIAMGIRHVVTEMHAGSGSTMQPDTAREGDAQEAIRQPMQPIAPGHLLIKYDAHADKVITVAWSSDGKLIASGGLDSTVHLWRAMSGQHLLTYRGHSRVFPPAAVYAVRWSPDGSRIASSGTSATVQVWDPTNGQKVAAYEGHSAMSRQ